MNQTAVFICLTALCGSIYNHVTAQNNKLATPASPAFAPYESISPNNNISKNSLQKLFAPNNQQSGHAASTQQSQSKNSSFSGVRQQQQITEVQGITQQLEYDALPSATIRKNQQQYRIAYDQLIRMLNTDSSFSLTKAVYLVENAYMEGRFSYEEYMELVNENVATCKYVLRQERLDSNDNLAKNYAIQKLYSQKIQLFNKSSGTTMTIAPFRYDFEDFRGDNDWTKMFVTKLLATGKGQCHSMPLLYLIVAEQMGAKAYLVLAPEHSYIKFTSGDGNLYNFETTQGKPVTDNAIIMSGFINATTIKNKIYLDTLSKKQLIATCIFDLTQGYAMKYGYDQFTESANQRTRNIDPNNIMALMMQADMKTNEMRLAAQKAGNPPVNKLPEYPTLYKLYHEMHDLYAQIDQTGYQAMPNDVYQTWLKSLQESKRQQESQELRELIRKKLKLPKSTFRNNID